ncbi:MAG: T9SS type A sorting domain-containing protein [Ignavibacteriales bacterium]|nr:T9SS type A sorting domain-containing protein [Ignavibacteriales bacterium]
MFDLRHFMLRFVPISGLLLLFVTTEVSAQFDSIIFARNDIYGPRGVLFMGDQNDDGCDDFVLVTYPSTWGYDAKALLFYGGNPINPNPVFEVAFKGSISNTISACDFNRDGYRDLIITTFNVKPLILNIYLGGPNMDTIPDFTFKAPDNSVASFKFIGEDWPVDMNGDGYEEMIVRAYEMFNRKSALLVYDSSPEMDSIPDQIVTYYPDEAIQGVDMTHGDLDGDGRTDLTFIITNPAIPVWADYRRFVFGRSDFSFEDTLNFMDSVDIVSTNRIIQDINKDGKADLLIYDTKYKYPYWYIMAVSYGSRNINYTLEEGFNTQNEGWLYSRSLGDVNGDGYGDFLTCLNYYGARLFLGGKHKPDDTPIKYYSGPTNIIERVGDVNGDGLDDIGIGVHGEPGAAQGTFYIMAGERVAMAIEDGETKTEEKEEITGLDLTISPNPTNGPVTVRFTMPDSGVIQLKIHDMLGQEIFNKTLYMEKGGQTEIINFKDITASTGIYILSLDLEKGGKHQNKNAKIQYLK